MAKKTKSTEVALVNEQNNGQQNINLVAATGFDYEKQIMLLSPKQRKEYLELARSIDEHDLGSIQQYGSDVSKVVESNGNALLENVRSTSNNEVVQMTNELLAQLNLIDLDELQSPSSFKRFLRRVPVLRNLVLSAENVINKYDNIRSNVDKIANKIRESGIIAKRDNNTLQLVFDNNVEYIKTIRELIIAAKLKDEELKAKIQDMVEHPDKYEAIEVHDARNFQNELEKRIANMEVTETIFNQNLFQIRAIQSNNHSLANTATEMVNNVIPIWKNQLTLSVVMNNQRNNIEAQKKVSETTNKILVENAKIMKQNSIEVAKASEQTVVSLDTLQQTTKSLIDTIAEVKKIQEDGKKMRATLEQNLVAYGEQLNNKILEINGTSAQHTLGN
jgi:uncharacterized protein YaaN involved in tellurite resistance